MAKNSLGDKKNMEMLLTAEAMGAEEALQRGLINRIYDEDKIEEETMKMALQIA